MPTEPFQPDLIPLTDEERRARAFSVSHLTLKLAELQEEHADRKKEMAEKERALLKQIHQLARCVRDGAERRAATGTP